MTTTLSTPITRQGSVTKAVTGAWLLIGTLDIIFACIQAKLMSGVNPDRVLNYVASGVFGKAAFAGGTMMAVWGLLFHYLIALGVTIFFFWVYPRIKWLHKNIWVTGIVYALFVWFVTARIIVPLSNTPPGAFRIDRALIAWGILIIAIGWPLAWCARRFYNPTSQ